MAHVANRRIVVAVCFVLAIFGTHAALADECGDFVPLRKDVVDMAFNGHTVFDDPTLGAAVSYASADGILTYYRFSLGFDRISKDLLNETKQLAVQDIQAVIEMSKGKVLQVVESGQTRTIGDVALSDVIVVADVSGSTTVNFLATGSDGRCLHKVRYTPDVTDQDDQGRNADGLVVLERFNRALDGLAPYFSG